MNIFTVDNQILFKSKGQSVSQLVKEGGTLIHFQKHSIVQLDDKIKLEFFC